MKRALVLTVLAVMSMGGWAMAADAAPDGGPGRGRPPGGMRNDPLKELNLTDEQKAKVKEIMEKARKDAEEIMKAAREKIAKEVLTDEQREKFAKMGPAGPHGAAMKELGLSDEQRAKIKEIMEKAREDAEAADEPREKHKIMQAAHEKVMKDVLTDEQREKFKKIRPPHPPGAPDGGGPGGEDGPPPDDR